MIRKRPEKDTKNPPGQIRNPIPQAKYLRDVIKRIEEQEQPSHGNPLRRCVTCGSRGFEISKLGTHRCTFCDGTEGGLTTS